MVMIRLNKENKVSITPFSKYRQNQQKTYLHWLINDSVIHGS